MSKQEEDEFMKDFQLLTDLFDLDELKQSENFAIKKYKESVYRGEILNKVRNGFGVCSYTNGRLYEGFWEQDLRHGKGYERFSNGN